VVRRGPRRWPAVLFLIAAVVVPAIFWRQVWWGAPLSNAEISNRLQLEGEHNPRQIQHAIEQVSERIQWKPESAHAFYPQIIALAEHDEPLVRAAVAWVMGEDNQHEPFRTELKRLLEDESLMVRYNAATALTRFAEEGSRPVLRAMLRPCELKAEWTGGADHGTIVDLLRPGDPVRTATRVALVKFSDEGSASVLAPLEGRVERLLVREGEQVRRGDLIAEIAPGADQVWAALRGLFLVGRTADLEDVERYLQPPAHFGRPIALQAHATAKAIRERE
jgi:hypothetical protein